MGKSDDFESEIKNQECKEKVGKYGPENIQGISFDIFLMESRIWNPESDTLILRCIYECGNTYKEHISR